MDMIKEILTDQKTTHAQWLTIIRYGLATIEQNDLLDFIKWEAERESEKSNGQVSPLDAFRGIIAELKLKLVKS